MIKRVLVGLIILILLQLVGAFFGSNDFALKHSKASELTEYRPKVLQATWTALENGKSQVLFTWQKPEKDPLTTLKKELKLPESDLKWELILKGPDAGGTYKEHAWQYAYSKTSIPIRDEVRWGGSYSSSLRLLYSSSENFKDSAKYDIIGYLILNFTLPSGPPGEYKANYSAGNTGGACIAKNLSAQVEIINASSNKYKVHFRFQLPSGTGCPSANNKGMAIYFPDGTRYEKDSTELNWSWSTKEGGEELFGLFKLVTIDVFNDKEYGFVKINVTKPEVNYAVAKSPGSNPDDTTTIPGGDTVDTDATPEESANATDTGDCKTPGVWQKFSNPIASAMQYFQCVMIGALTGAIKEMLDWLVTVSGMSYLPGGTLKISGLALGGLEVAHAGVPLSKQLDPTSSQKREFVITAWGSVRTFIDVFVILGLILIAFANVFHISIDTYTVKKSLPGLILGVVLANFSLFICRALVDVNAVVGTQLAGGFEDVAKTYTGIITPFLAGGSTMFFLPGAQLWGFLLIAAILLGIFGGIVAIAFLLYIRLAVMYVLVAVSPLAFLSLGLPITRSFFQKWWGEMLRWTFMPVVIFFILNLVGMFGQSAAATKEISILNLMIVIAFTYAAFLVPFKLGGAVMGFWGGTIGKQIAKRGLGAGKGYIDTSRFGGRAPWNIYKGWKGEKERQYAIATKLNEGYGGQLYNQWKHKDLRRRGDTVRISQASAVAEEKKRLEPYDQSGLITELQQIGVTRDDASIMKKRAILEKLSENYDPNELLRQVFTYQAEGLNTGDFTNRDELLGALGYQGAGAFANFQARLNTATDGLGGEAMGHLTEDMLGGESGINAANAIQEIGKKINAYHWDGLTSVNNRGERVYSDPATRNAIAFANSRKIHRQLGMRNRRRGDVHTFTFGTQFNAATGQYESFEQAGDLAETHRMKIQQNGRQAAEELISQYSQAQDRTAQAYMDSFGNMALADDPAHGGTGEFVQTMRAQLVNQAYSRGKNRLVDDLVASGHATLGRDRKGNQIIVGVF